MSVVLNGFNQYLYSFSVPVQSWPVTISAWFKANMNDVTGVIAAIDRIASSGYKILCAIDAAGGVQGDPVQIDSYTGSSWRVAVTGLGYQPGVWVHAVGVFENANMSSYINGGGKGVWNDVFNTSPQEVVIGARRTGLLLGFFSGKVANVAIWNAALTEQEVVDLRDGVDPTMVRPEGLIRYWPMYDGGIDVSGNGGDLSIVGGPLFDINDHPIYGPVEPEYERTQLVDMPEPKEQFGFEELNGSLYAVCGVTSGGTHSSAVYAYNVASGEWSRKADAPIAVQSPVLRAVAGRLYLIGGYRSDIPMKYDSCYEYDPSTDSWTQKASMPTAREDAGSAVVGGKIYVFGGLTNPAHTMVSSIDVYDPATNTWETRVWNSPRALGDFAVAYNGKIYLMGGTRNMSQYPSFQADTTIVEYDPETDTWTEKATGVASGCYREAEELNGVLYAVSGVFASTTDYTSMASAYNPITGECESLPGFSYAARGIGLAKSGNSLYVAGGYSGVVLSCLWRITHQS